MPDEAAGGTTGEPSSLAEKIQFLRALTTPKGESQPSYERLAALIEQDTGVAMSGAHIFNMAKGHQPDPKISHVRAIARFFRVPVGYLVGDGGDYRRLEAELELLDALKRGGVTELGVKGDLDSVAGPDTVRAVLRQLDELAVFGDARLRALAVSLSALGDEPRRTAEEVIADPDLLNSMQQEEVRSAARKLGELGAEHLAVLTELLEQPAVLDALKAEAVRVVASRASDLSPQSLEAVLAVINRLRDVEAGSRNP